jgi:hypothetical protein
VAERRSGSTAPAPPAALRRARAGAGGLLLAKLAAELVRGFLLPVLA